MKLAQFQRLMAGDVMRPLTRLDGVSRENQAASYVKPNERLTSAERLEIYARSYWFRILDSLADDFPGLKALLGDGAFTKLSEAYLTACPSTSFTLANLGSKLETWLRANPRWAGRGIGPALDMVRLEWAHIEAFDGGEFKPIGPEDLAEFDPALELGLQPYVRLLELCYPVDELRLQVNTGTGGSSAASNAVSEKHRSGNSSKPQRISRQTVFVAVHRNDGCVYYRRLEPAEFGLLKLIAKGGRFDRLMLRALKSPGAPVEEFQSSLQGWFAAWAQLGWLCRPAKKATGRGKPNASDL